jgi:hypothetical protein
MKSSQLESGAQGIKLRPKRESSNRFNIHEICSRAFSGLTDLLGGFPKFRESDSRRRLVKEASLYDPTSFD